MLALGIDSPPQKLSAKRKDSYLRINGKKFVDEYQQNLKKHQTDKLIQDIKLTIGMGITKNKLIYQYLEDNFLMPEVAGEYPSDNALRIYVRKAKQQMSIKNES